MERRGQELIACPNVKQPLCDLEAEDTVWEKSVTYNNND